MNPSRDRRPRWMGPLPAPGSILTGLIGMLLLLPADPALAARESPPSAMPPPRIRIERIEVEGNHRTPTARVLLVAGLRAGEAATPRAILTAAQRLRSTHLFRDVDVYARSGSRPGLVIVVFQVKENHPHVRLGVGYEDLSGWYLIPIQLNLDNLTGSGEVFHLSTRLGFRVSGLVLSYRRPSLREPRRSWEFRARAEAQDRLYFYDETEIRHRVGRAGLDLRGELPVSASLSLGGWLALENVQPDSSAVVHRDNRVRDRQQGETVPFEELPGGIRDAIAGRTQGRLGVALDVDTRAGRGLLVRGAWGRTLIEMVSTSEEDFGRWEWDLRGYLPLGRGTLLAARTRAGAATRGAPFHERYYLGGLYTIRGYPSQSLSAPQGDRYFATASIELRAPWIGPPENPRLAGLLLLDLGIGWEEEPPRLEEGAAGIGWGWRLRLPWIGYLGLDIARPLDPSPVKEAFHGNLSIGWTY